MEKVDLKEIGARISKLRKQRGFTQESLAENMDVSIQMISNLERGNKAIKIDNLINLSRILGVSTDYILTGKACCEASKAIENSFNALCERDKKIIEQLICYCAEQS